MKKISQDWSSAFICPLYKKGNPLLRCYNYRGIVLLNVSYKILAYSYNTHYSDRIKPHTGELLGDYQSGIS